MKITDIIFNKDILSFDTKSRNNILILFKDRSILWNKHKIVIPSNIPVNNETLFVKIISKSSFLLINKDLENVLVNTWIINNKGNIQKELFLDSPSKIITTSNKIICSYPDSQMGINCLFGDAQLLVFDFDGNILFKYNSPQNTSKISFLENKEFLRKDDNTIYFTPYPDFSIIAFNLVDYSSKIIVNQNTAVTNYFFSSLSTKENKWYFFDYQKNKPFIYECSDELKLSHKIQLEDNALYFLSVRGQCTLFSFCWFRIWWICYLKNHDHTST